MPATVIIAIEEFDGKHVGPLRAIAKRGLTAKDLDEVAGFCAAHDPGAQIAATWLVKAHLEAGGTLTPMQTDKVMEACKRMKPWEAQLHLLQSLPLMTMRKKHITALRPFLNEALTAKKVFVRAWAMSAAVELADLFTALAPMAKTALAEGLHSDKASIRARANALLSARSKDQ